MTAHKLSNLNDHEELRMSAPLWLARNMARTIIDSRAPVGTRLGSLPEVARRFGVSVATLRKALTYLLDDGIVTAREGRGGGLIVGSLPADSAMRAMFLYLSDREITSDQVREAQILLDSAIIERAVRLVNNGDLEHMVAAFNVDSSPQDTIIRLEDAVLSTARQPILALFSRLASRFAQELEPDVAFDIAEERQIRSATIDAVLSGNIFEAMVQWRSRKAIGGGSAPQSEPSTRLAEAIAGSIRTLIQERGLIPGDELGHEAELQSRFDSSSVTVRNALRILERSGVVRVSQGRNGGVFVGAAEPYAAIEMTSLYLSAIHLDFATQIEARRVVEARAAELAAQRVTPEQSEQLEAALEADSAASRSLRADWPQHGARVERLIAQACDNPLIEFFTLALIELSMAGTGMLERSLPESDFARLVSMHHATIGGDILANRPINAAFHTRVYLTDLARWIAFKTAPQT